MTIPRFVCKAEVGLLNIQASFMWLNTVGLKLSQNLLKFWSYFVLPLKSDLDVQNQFVEQKVMISSSFRVGKNYKCHDFGHTVVLLKSVSSTNSPPR